MSPSFSQLLRGLRRTALFFAYAIGVLLTFVVALVGSVLLHLDAPGARRLALRELNAVLAGQFTGKVVVTRLGHLSLFGVAGVDAEVTAEDGTRVLLARGVSAVISPVALVKSAVFGKGDRLVTVDRITIDAVDVDVDSAADGRLKLVSAFDAKTPPTPPTPGARGTDIKLSDIRLSHAWAHGVVAGAPPVDADVDESRVAFLSTPTTTKLDVLRLAVHARALPMGMRAFVVAQAELAMPSATGTRMGVRAALAATVGQIPLTANLVMDGDALDAALDVPEVAAADVRASVEGAPVYEAVAAHAEAHGPLANLTTALHAALGAGSLDVAGKVHAAEALGAELTLDVRHLDARTFSEEGPATDVSLHATATAETKADKNLVGTLKLDLAPGIAAGQRVPHTTLQAEVEQRTGREASRPVLTAHVEGIADEPGAPLALTADARSVDGVSTVTFGAKADAVRLEDVARLGHLGSGSVEVSVSGNARIAGRITFEAELNARGRSLDARGVRVADVQVVGKASGSPAAPVVEARALAHGVSASGYQFARVEVEGAGSPSDVRIAGSGFGLATGAGKKGPDVKFHTDLALLPALALRDTQVTLDRGVEDLIVSADSFRVEGHEIDVSGVTVRGAGEPLSATLRSLPGILIVKAKSRGLDLAKLAHLAGQDGKVGGNLALDVDLDARRDHARGAINLDLTQGSVSSVRDASAHVKLALEGRHVTGELHASAGDAGAVDLRDVDVHVGGGGALDARAWRVAWGNIGLVANLDLARVASVLPAGALGLTDLAGRVSLDGDLHRDSLEDTTPEIRLSVVTNGFRAIGQSTAPVRVPGGPLMVGPATWSIYGLDLRSDLLVDGVDSAGELDLRVVDPQGAIVSLDIKTDPLPFAAVFAGRSDVLAELEELPIGVRLDMPQRELSQLPLLVRPDGVQGGAGVELTMTGNARAPQVDLKVHTQALTFAAAKQTPMDGDVTARYDGSVATLGAKLTSNNQALLDASATFRAEAKALLAMGATAPWSASAKATLARFPLHAISLLSEDQVKGFVSGEVSLSGLHEQGSAVANLAFDGLQLGKAKFRSGEVDAKVDDHGLTTKARFDTTDGFLEANAKMGMKWGSELAPSSDGSGVQATLVAKRFPAGAAAPFASAAVSELSGWLDADAKFALVPGQKPRMSGSLVFSDGVVQAPAIGEAFHAVKARVTLTEDGVVKLDDVQADGLSGRLTAQGSARLDGTTLLGADLALTIPKSASIPLDVQGTNLGSVYGNVTVKATGSSDGAPIKVAVTVPSFHVQLPEAGFPRAPQGLADAAGVHLGVYRNPDRFIVLAADGAPVTLVAARNEAIASLPTSGGLPPRASPPAGQAEAAKEKAPGPSLEVAVKLGTVEIVRGQQLVVDLDGSLNAKVGAATQVRGQIRVKSGKLEVQSKEFDIERGTISFVGDDPANPEVNLTAGWTAPDGTRVLADYIGPVKTGKVALRSEPPRPKNEIVSLILFGSADGSSSTPYASKSPSTGTQAGTAVGGLGTDGLSKGLDQLTGMNVTAKIDTSDSANPRPEVEVQIAKDISLELSVVLGTPPPGTNPDTSYVTIDWRFVRNWSLATTFGDEGSTFADLLWQYRY